MSPRSRTAADPESGVETPEPEDGEAEDGQSEDGESLDGRSGTDPAERPEAAIDEEPAGPEPDLDDGPGSDTGSLDQTEPLGLAAVLAERDAYLADLQRVTAEFTNFRRQTVKRNTDLVSQAASRLAMALLPVLDAVEAAVGQGVEGMEAVQAQLIGVLSAEGLAVLGAVDEPFDPGVHEAVISEEADEEREAGPVVAQVLRTGYAWNGRVLRPAMVKVRT